MKKPIDKRLLYSPALFLLFAILVFSSCKETPSDLANSHNMNNVNAHVNSNESIKAKKNSGSNTLPGPNLDDFPSNGNTYYVSTSGSDDSGDGSQSNPYATVNKAYQVASDGATIKIEAGTYNGNDAGLAVRKKNLHFKGINGRPHMKLQESDKPTGYKGVWVLTPDAENISIDNIEFSGAHISARLGGNAAGIRMIGVRNVKIRNCYMHNNQNGILSSVPKNSHVVVKNSEFAKNGAGDGQSHGNYFSGSGILTYAYNYNHDVDNGNILKTRMHVNYILYNKIIDGSDANYTANYNIDIPDGGVAYVIGNVIEQASYTDPSQYNNQLLEYGVENLHSYDENALYVINNTFINGIDSGKFLFLHDKPGLEVVSRNNIFTGGGIVDGDQSYLTKGHNFRGDPGYADASNNDFHLTSSSSEVIDAGVDPGNSRYGFDLIPMMEYVHVADSQQRIFNGSKTGKEQKRPLPDAAQHRSIKGSKIDLGAFEF